MNKLSQVRPTDWDIFFKAANPEVDLNSKKCSQKKHRVFFTGSFNLDLLLIQPIYFHRFSIQLRFYLFRKSFLTFFWARKKVAENGFFSGPGSSKRLNNS